MKHRPTRRSALRHFWNDDNGSITLEFVLWVPFLTFWAVFTLAVFHAMDNRADAAKATYTLADVISRQAEVDNAYINQISRLLDEVLPGSQNGATVRISSVPFEDGAYKVRWSKCFGDIPPLADADIPLGDFPFTGSGKEQLLVETYVPYLPIFDIGGLEPFVWTHKIVIEPRWDVRVADQDNGANACKEEETPSGSGGDVTSANVSP